MDWRYGRHIAGAALLLAALGAAAPAWAQLGPTSENPNGAGTEPLRPSVEYRPERVRALMLSIHGYTKAALQAASVDAEQILMMYAGDPQEAMVVRRQAVKGLRLFPQDSTLRFIESTMPGSPEGLKRLYLDSLEGFAAGFPDRVTALAGTALNDPLVTVRSSALHLTGVLQQTAGVRQMLESRLAVEPDAGLRSRIQQRLNAN